MKCVYCGATLKEGMDHCNACGKEILPDLGHLDDDYLQYLIEDDMPSAPPEKKQKPAPPKPSRQPEPQKKTNGKTILLILLPMFLIIAATITAYFIYTDKKEEKRRLENSFDYQFSKGLETMNQDTSESISYFKRALELNQTSLPAKKYLSELYMRQKRTQEALPLLQEIIKEEPANTTAYQNLLSIYESNADFESIVKLEKTVTDSDVLKLFEQYLVQPPVFFSQYEEEQQITKVMFEAENKYNVLYSMDESLPLSEWKRYVGPIVLNEEKRYHISAVCVDYRGIYSEVVTHDYDIVMLPPEMPVVTPDGGNFSTPVAIEVEIPRNCKAYYTWDGTNPTEASALYEDTIEMPEGHHILSVILVDQKTKKASSVYRGNFRYKPPKKTGDTGGSP